MIDDEKTIGLLLRFGLKLEEIEVLSIQKAISYIRCYHEKKFGKSSILFRGFSQDDEFRLGKIAEINYLTVKSRISSDLTFLCISERAAKESVEKAKGYGTRILNKTEFDIIFPDVQNGYDLQDNEFLYDFMVPVELRIAKPLSNFDRDVKIQSFSLANDKFYEVNIFKMTCSCPDFEMTLRSQYATGDARRLCKHLMAEYKNSFGLIRASKFIDYIFHNNFSLKKHFRDLVLENTNQKIVLNFDNANDWWAVFVQDENGSYQRYGYSPAQKGFAYNAKPRGIVIALRTRLDQIYDQFDGKRHIAHKRKMTIRQNKKDNDLVQGCVYLFIITLVVAIIISFLF